jgi:hypothetical protein
MKKIKIFRDHEEYCVNPSGSSYVTATWAQMRQKSLSTAKMLRYCPSIMQADETIRLW